MISRSFAILCLIAATRPYLAHGDVLRVSFEAEIVSPDWQDEFPFGVGRRITGDFGISSNASDPGTFEVESPRIHADGVLLAEASSPSNFVQVSDNYGNIWSPASPIVDQIVICLGAAMPFQINSSEVDFEIETPCRVPDAICPHAGPAGYGVYIRISGPPSWFTATEGIHSILASIPDQSSIESWFEYNGSGRFGSSHYSDLRIIKLMPTPEPPSEFLGLLSCAAAMLGGRFQRCTARASS